MSNVVTYDDLIEDQVAAIEGILEEDVSYAIPCKGCLENVPVPEGLVGIVDVVYCNDCSKALLWDQMATNLSVLSEDCLYDNYDIEGSK